MFSKRTPEELSINKFSQLLEKKRAAGTKLIDLTESNPTRVNLSYAKNEILNALTHKDALLYNPDPKGILKARQAVVDYYQARKIHTDVDNIIITASTSEAYTMLFKLLGEPDDSFLVPTPSYPLFEHLAYIEGVRPIPYPIVYDGDWHIDFAGLRSAIEPSTRAIIIVNPNNPTGSFISRGELDKLIEVCREYNLPLISDEVFFDYAHFSDTDRAPSTATVKDILTFTLNGLSKAAGLPQMKLGWIVVNGPEKIFPEALNRLEFIADLFLSVSAPVQHALPIILPLAEQFQAELRARVIANHKWLKGHLPVDSAYRLLPTEGGWYAILQVPRIKSEEDLIIELLEKDDLIIHPGYFFDFETEGWLIMSLINTPEIFQAGIKKLLDRLATFG